MSDWILKVNNLRAYYRASKLPVRAVDGVDFMLNKSEILGISGESGCGKSTLALAVMNLLEPPGYILEGDVLFNNESDIINIAKLNEDELKKIRFKHISYIPQGSMNSLNPVMRVKDQIYEVIREHGGKIDKNFMKEKVNRLLESVGLAPEVAKMFPHELSGGMKQSVIIAIAILLNPNLIIADEPTTALDVVTQRGIMQLLINVKHKIGSSIILITHDIAVQAEVSDTLAIMYAGKIVELCKTKEIFDEPLHPYTSALISAVPMIGSKKKIITLQGLPPDLKSPPPGCRFHPRCPRFIKGKCDNIEPEFREIETDRFVACHLY
jgi:peptide/nickel transport system ATP-binding protein